MRRFIRWLSSLVAWREVRRCGAWLYLENNVTGQRSAHSAPGLWGPLDHGFMRPGDLVCWPDRTETL